MQIKLPMPCLVDAEIIITSAPFIQYEQECYNLSMCWELE